MFLFKYLRCLARIILFLAGFYSLPLINNDNSGLKYDRKNNMYYMDSNCRIIVSNHTSIWDGFIIYYYTGCSIIVKKTLMDIPIINTLLGGMQCVGVERKTANGRKLAKQRINKHICNELYPPLLVFPQGTTTLHSVMTLWKRGAFELRLPVQPTIIYYRNKNGLLDFVDQTMVFNVYYCCCQFVNYASIEFVNIYKPNKEEILFENGQLYADNVRKLVCNKMGAISTNHSFEDYNILFKVKSYTKINFDHMILHNIRQTWDMPSSVPIKLLNDYLKYIDCFENEKTKKKEYVSGTWNRTNFLRFFYQKYRNKNNSPNNDYNDNNSNTNNSNTTNMSKKLEESVNLLLLRIYNFLDANNNDLIEFEEFLSLIAIMLCKKNVDYCISIYFSCLFNSINNDINVLDELIKLVSQQCNNDSNNDSIDEFLGNLRKLSEIVTTIKSEEEENRNYFSRFYQVMRQNFSLMRSINGYFLSKWCKIQDWKNVNFLCR